MELEAQPARAAMGDFPPEALRVVAPHVSPDGTRAGALRRPVVDGWFIGVVWEAPGDEDSPQLYRTLWP
jgi:hypothetical protein